MSQAKAENSTPKPISRQVVEAQIDLLIDMLNTMDGDPDAEPSLGFSNGGYRPEDQPQEGFALHMNADAGRDMEDEHDGAEPHEDSEPSLGWTSQINQTSPGWQANHLGTVDLEAGVGPVRKKRPASRTGNRVLAMVEVF
ncbi:hypothetical protein [Bradyrhizobium manausense]|uniref:Uncharacterized protein n=1 Tax=Bradyrhizobium manausense TaxID=989370 RepID=A0A0R3D6P9_9BRAD|nr:hypothetical protein [Bradyrhizobium manausense]KRQ03077.1 hypothetical protein AOQ71_30395 [Bradyrhizobium manausense]